MFNYTLKPQGIDVVDTVLTNRSLTLEEVNLIMNATFEDCIEKASDLKNIDKGVEMLNNALKNCFKIGILIDSDCDGYCSAAMMYHYLTEKIGYKNVIYKFHEKHKAHGIQDYVVEWIYNEEVNLLIVPDAGCGASDEVNQILLNNAGIEILILDHHIPEYTPTEKTVIINPHQNNDFYSNKYLSGAGVTHKFIEYHSEIESRGEVNVSHLYDDLVALSLVSDMMNLKESIENRAYLNFGVENIKSPFILAVAEKIGKDVLTIEDIGFSISPLINATVRFGNEEREIIFRSLFSDEKVKSQKRGMVGELVPISEEAVRIAGNLKRKQDKERDRGVTALSKLTINEEDKVIILIVDDLLDSSITGLIANKLVNTYNKPVILLKTVGDGLLGGSARTFSNNPKLVNFKSICLSTGLFEFCSGHEGSFGVGISYDNLEKVRNTFNEIFKDISTNVSYEIDGIYDERVPESDIRDISNLQKLWCFDIKEPIFLVQNVKVNTSNIRKVGNATYTFKSNRNMFTKFYGSKLWFSKLILEDELPFGGDIEVDIICRFRKVKVNNVENYIIEMLDVLSRVDEDYDF